MREDEQPQHEKTDQQLDIEQFSGESSSETVSAMLIGNMEKHKGEFKRGGECEAADLITQSSSRTESFNYVGSANKRLRLGGNLESQVVVERNEDSKTLVGNNNSNFQASKRLLPFDNIESDSFDCPLNIEVDSLASPRRRSKSKGKRKRLLRKKCNEIKKKILKKPTKKKHSKKNGLELLEGSTIPNSILQEARDAWEATKAAGLAIEGPDEEIILQMARDSLEERTS